jgi:hypothetical protein
MQLASKKNSSGPLEGDALADTQKKYKLEEDLRDAISNRDAHGTATATKAITDATKGANPIIDYKKASDMINDAHVYKDRLTATVRRLGLEDSLQVYDSAGIFEQRKLRETINKKIMDWYQQAEEGKKTSGQLASMRPRISKFFSVKP